MDKKTARILNIILWIFLIWSSVYILTYEGNNTSTLIFLIILLCLSIFFSQHLAEKLKIKESTLKFNLFLNSALIYWIALIDNSGASQILFFILTSYMIILFTIKYGIISASVNFLSFCIIDYIKLDYPSLSVMFLRMFQYLFSFGFVFGFSFVAKLEIIQREKLDKTTKELERAYEKLQESYDTKEQLLIERERNRIAGEIHDTVGHTLTTVIVELEASKRLMKKDMELSLEKLELAQEQVRKGLNDIRKSVRALKNGDEVLDFTSSIITLIRETEKHSGVTIVHNIDDLSYLDREFQMVMLRALQEGLTNGIRHGHSTEYFLSIKKIDNYIAFNLTDKGHGAEDLVFGFGLSNMKHRVEKLNGKLTVRTEKNKGCRIEIDIPLRKGEEDGKD